MRQYEVAIRLVDGREVLGKAARRLPRLLDRPFVLTDVTVRGETPKPDQFVAMAFVPANVTSVIPL